MLPEEQCQSLLGAVLFGQHAAQIAHNIGDPVAWRRRRQMTQSGAVRCFGFAQPPQHHEGLGHVEMGRRVVGLVRQGDAVGLDRFLRLFLVPQRDPKIIARCDMAGVRRQGLSGCRRRLAEQFQRQPGIAAIQVQQGIVRLQARRALQVVGRVGRQTPVQAQHPEQMQGVEVLGALGDDVQRAPGGGVVFPRAVMDGRSGDRGFGGVRH